MGSRWRAYGLFGGTPGLINVRLGFGRGSRVHLCSLGFIQSRLEAAAIIAVRLGSLRQV